MTASLFNNSTARQVLIVIGSIGVTAACVFSIVRSQSQQPAFNVEIHEAIGEVMAKKAAELIHNKGKVVIVTIPAELAPELRVQIEAFEQVLKQFPKIRIKEKYELDPGPKLNYSFGSGLSGRRYVRLVNKNKSADVFVSFIGAPNLDDGEVSELQASPKFVAEARSFANIERLFRLKLLHAAVVSRFQFPGPIRGTPRTTQEWFDQRYQILTASNVDQLPLEEGE